MTHPPPDCQGRDRRPTRSHVTDHLSSLCNYHTSTHRRPQHLPFLRFRTWGRRKEPQDEITGYCIQTSIPQKYNLILFSGVNRRRTLAVGTRIKLLELKKPVRLQTPDSNHLQSPDTARPFIFLPSFALEPSKDQHASSSDDHERNQQKTCFTSSYYETYSPSSMA